MNIFSMFLLLAAFASAPPAQETVKDPAPDEAASCCCTTYDTNVCLEKIQDKAAAALNAAYEKSLAIAAAFTGTDVENLKDAEHKWIAYRDASCKAEHGLWGKGTGGPNADARCVIKLTRQRTADLKITYLERLH